MATLKDVEAVQTDINNAIGGLVNLVAGLEQKIADALSGVKLPPNVQEDVDKVFADANDEKQKLADLLAANTPVNTDVPFVPVEPLVVETPAVEPVTPVPAPV